jgi:hypothetical protein
MDVEAMDLEAMDLVEAVDLEAADRAEDTDPCQSFQLWPGQRTLFEAINQSRMGCCLKTEVGVFAKLSLNSPRKTHSSCPDLIRASINLRDKFFEKDGSPGQAR